MKKIMSMVLIIALFTSLTACEIMKAEPIVLPLAADIKVVKITQGQQIHEITDADWISALVKKMGEGEATIKESINDAPNVDEYTKIEFVLKDSQETMYIFQEKEKWYIEQPYRGIYQTDEKLSEMITARVRVEQMRAEQEAVEKAVKLDKIIPTNRAEAIGITVENYPRIDGSTSTLPLVQAIYKSMFKPVPSAEGELQGYPAQASKTIKSYELLMAGEVDLILVPDPSKDIVDMLAEAGIELEYIPVGAEALVFVTHEKNSVENITKEQVQQIYSSMDIKNWSALGGADGRIVPICRNADAGSQAQLENFVLEGKPIAPEIEENYMERDMNGMLQMVEDYSYFAHENEKNAYAIGYTMYYYINLFESIAGEIEIKPLAYEGIAPSPETILSKEYPLATNYYAVIRKDTPEDHSARKIASWLITTQGQWQVLDSGLGALRPLYEPVDE